MAVVRQLPQKKLMSEEAVFGIRASYPNFDKMMLSSKCPQP
jgi:hypothetical protein